MSSIFFFFFYSIIFSMKVAFAFSITDKTPVLGSSEGDQEIIVDDLTLVHSRARNLVEEFDEFTLLIQAKIANVDTSVLITRLALYISREEEDKSISELFVQLNAMSTPKEVLIHLIVKKCIGYLNYDLLKVFHKTVGKDDEVESKFAEYETSVKRFLRGTKLCTIANLFQQYPEFAPHSLVGLPKFTVTLNTEWEGKSIFQWKELLAKKCPWASNVQIINITRNCIFIVYSVLPFFAPAVVRDLTDPLVLAVLKRQGVTVKLSQELMNRNSQQLSRSYAVKVLIKHGVDVHGKCKVST